MNLDYTFFYTEANVVCIIIFVMLLIKDLGGVGRQAKQITFINIVFAHIFLSAITSFWFIYVELSQGEKYELTASIGYASYNGDLTAFQAALNEADEALYKDKAARR